MLEGCSNGSERPIKPFQFIEGRPTKARFSQDSNKENEADPEQSDKLIIDDGQRQPSQPKSPEVSFKPFPSTPATRLPLADLIGNAEDANKGAANAQVSPEEHIQWHPLRSPKGSQSRTTPVSNGKKRARSTSPPSSTRKDAGKRAEADGAIDVDNLKPTLKTPRRDPVADLWNRYAIGTNKDGAAGGHGTIFTNLISTSSPQPGEDQASNVGGFRRWTSCGLEWPSSKSKRRKLRHPVARENGVAEIADPLIEVKDQIEGDRKTSRIGSLIERIQESLTKPAEPLEAKAPSSSSPLPDRIEMFDRKSVSPTRALETKASLTADAVLAPVEGTHDRNDPSSITLREKISTSSSFGSDDMDFAEFVRPAPWHEVNHSTERSMDTPMHNDQIENAVGHMKPEAASAQGVEEQNEFDDDDDFTMEDFDEASRCQQRRPDEGQTAERVKSLNLGAQASNIGGNTDDFDDDDVNEELFEAAEYAATQSLRTSSDSKYPSNQKMKKQAIQRYLVKDIAEGFYTASDNQRKLEKVLLVDDETSRLSKGITLRQTWYETRCSKGSYVHVVGNFDDNGQCLIDDSQNMIVIHPDHLISATVVADSFTCLRRAVLQDRIKATSDSNPAVVYGTLLHEIFQEALRANRWDPPWLRKTIEAITARHIEDIYEIKLDIPHVVDHLQSKMPELQAWAEIFVKTKPDSSAVVKDRHGKQVLMSVNKLLDAEEHIWSPKYGLKGSVDASVQVNMFDEAGERTLIAPLEVKTGKNSTNASHRAQTALYTLLLSDRYDVAVAYGILYYLETSEVSRIPAIRHELRHMIMQRNELAGYVRERLSLPPMLNNPHACNRCYAKIPCFTYHKLVEDGNGESSGLREKFDEVVQHLNHSDQQFLKKWDDLLTKEEGEMMKFRRELWTMASNEREKLGRCFANVILDPGSESEDTSSSKINRFRYTFRKFNQATNLFFNEAQITVGEPIVISDEQGHYALAKGYVTNLQKRHVTVAVDRRLHNARTKQKGFDPETNQVFTGIMEIPNSSSTKPSPTPDAKPILYRLDKDEFSSGMATVRNNLVELMRDGAFRSRELRQLIVEEAQPRFRQPVSAYELSGPPSQLSMNDDQCHAIQHILAAEDYALVLGMPGTGKTTTIAHIIRALVAKGKSVLLTSYTHTAVDNILLKIRQDHIEILRLGALAKIHPEVREFAYLAAEPKASIEELEKTYQTPQVVATTCLGVNHPVFKERIFDYCIVDEASQITLPVCLGPIRMAKVFVLVGDHYQLPPLVQNREAQDGGLDVSLFKVLSDQHPSAVATLRYQYRMNDAIMSLSNRLIYNGRLVCGSEAIAKRSLDIPNLNNLNQLHASHSSQGLLSDCSSLTSLGCWLNNTLSPGSAPVVFLNTDGLRPHSLETQRGSRVTNPLEARITTQLLNAILLAGVAPSSIGIITLYRSQLALIKSLLQVQSSGSVSRLISHPATAAAEQVEAHTADRFQGRDKDVILLSCVRSNNANNVGDLLRDWRRVNVAITRARSKLIIIGSRSTLEKGDELLGKLVECCENDKWIIDLPAMAAEESGGHVWDASPIRASNTTNEGQMDASSITAKMNEPTQQDGAAHQPPSQTTAGRATPLSRPGNVNKAFKIPAKVGKVTSKTVFGGSNTRVKRPVLADIVNDVIGEGFFD